MLLPPLIAAILEREVSAILTRIAAAASSHEAQMLKSQYEERLAHLLERIGQEAFDRLVAAVSPKPAPASEPAKPTDVTATSPAASPPSAPAT